MAISLKAVGSWAELTADGTVSIPGSPAAGDRMLLFASWKTYTITASVSGWTAIGSEFADGTVGAGNNTGSMKVMAWYRDWQSGDGDPTIDFSSSPTIAGAVIQVWQKGGSESWGAPLTATAALSWGTSSTTTSASSTTAVPDGAAVMALLGFRDDSATMTRPTTAIDVASGITWNGDHVESPATHLTTTTNQDMSADLGYRLVTTGATVTLRVTGTLSASETGAAKWVTQGLAAPATTANAGVATSTGAANQPSASVTANAGVATATGTAHDASAYPSITASAGVATATGAAQGPSPDVTASADAATASGTGQAASGQASANAEVATATAAALDATAQTGAVANAGAATATALGAAVLVAAPVGVATGTGTAQGPSVAVTASAMTAEAIAAAWGVTAETGVPVEEPAVTGGGRRRRWPVERYIPVAIASAGVARAHGSAHGAHGFGDDSENVLLALLGVTEWGVSL